MHHTMIQVLGLVCMLAFSQAGGYHSIKGGIKSDASQTQVEGLLPPYGIKTAPSAQGSLYGLRSGQRRFEFTSASVKTAEHRPPAQEETKTGSIGNADVASKTSAVLRQPGNPPLVFLDSERREPTAKPVQPIRKTTIQGLKKQVYETPIAPTAITYDSNINALRGVDGSNTLGTEFSGGLKEVIVYDDGTIVEAGGARFGSAGGFLVPNIASTVVHRTPISIPGPVSPQISSVGAKEVIVYDDGTIVEVGGTGSHLVSNNDESMRLRVRQPFRPQSFTRTRVSSGATGSQDNNIRFVLGNSVGTSSGISTNWNSGLVPDTQPKLGNQEAIVTLNRQLIQKQNEAGVLPTFDGVVRSDNLDGASITSEEINSLRQKVTQFSSKPLVTSQVTPIRPTFTGQSNVKPSSISDRTVQYRNQITAQRTTSSRGSSFQGSSGSTTGGNINFVLGNTENTIGSTRSISQPKPAILTQTRPGITSNDDIIALNRNLIKKQNEEGLSQTFGGVVDIEKGNVEVSSAGINDLRRRVQSSRGPFYGNSFLSGPQTGNNRFVLSNTANLFGTRYAVNQGNSIDSTRRIYGIQNENRRFVLGNTANILDTSRITPIARRPGVYAPPITSTNAGIIPTWNQNIRYTLGKVDEKVSYINPLPKMPFTQPVITLQNQQIVNKNQGLVSPGSISTGSNRGGFSSSSVGILTDKVGYVDQRIPLAPRPVETGSLNSANDDIITLNRALIQKQNEAGISQVFGGVIDVEDGKLQDVSVSSDVVKDLRNKVTQLRPETPSRNYIPEVRPLQRPRPVTAYTGSRIQSTYNQRNQGDNVRFVLGNNADTIRSSQDITKSQETTEDQPVLTGTDDIIALNRELIRKQNQAGLDEVFDGISKDDGNLEGVAIFSEDLKNLREKIGYGANAASVPVYSNDPQQINLEDVSVESKPDQNRIGVISQNRFTNVKDIPSVPVNVFSQEHIPIDQSVKSSVKAPAIQNQQKFEQIVY